MPSCIVSLSIDISLSISLCGCGCVVAWVCGCLGMLSVLFCVFPILNMCVWVSGWVGACAFASPCALLSLCVCRLSLRAVSRSLRAVFLRCISLSIFLSLFLYISLSLQFIICFRPQAYSWGAVCVSLWQALSAGCLPLSESVFSVFQCAIPYFAFTTSWFPLSLCVIPASLSMSAPPMCVGYVSMVVLPICPGDKYLPLFSLFLACALLLNLGRERNNVYTYKEE